MLKAGTMAEGQEQVDALSGATITSTGVSDMLKANLAEYSEFLNVLIGNPAPAEEEIVESDNKED